MTFSVHDEFESVGITWAHGQETAMLVGFLEQLERGTLCRQEATASVDGGLRGGAPPDERDELAASHLNNLLQTRSIQEKLKSTKSHFFKGIITFTSDGIN